MAFVCMCQWLLQEIEDTKELNERDPWVGVEENRSHFLHITASRGSVSNGSCLFMVAVRFLVFLFHVVLFLTGGLAGDVQEFKVWDEELSTDIEIYVKWQTPHKWNVD